jgi:HSP20 family protein
MAMTLTKWTPGRDYLVLISGEKKVTDEVKEEQFHRIERHYGSFSPSFSLPPTIDATKVSADYKNGVLTLRLPLREEAKPRQIDVNIAA